jgi:8-hydroxy-5-deazaflavin:NADPH oxidoreductase
MTTAVIGTGGLGSVIARHLASGGETLWLSSADTASARTLAAQIGRAAVVAVDNREALGGDLHGLVVGPAEARSLIRGA